MQIGGPVKHEDRLAKSIDGAEGLPGWRIPLWQVDKRTTGQLKVQQTTR